MNLLTLSSLAHNKESSVQFLQQNGILHTIRKCSNNHSMTLSLSDRQDRWRCNLRSCREDIPIRKGTWLEGSRLTYRQIILFVYCWSKELTSVKFCESELDISINAVIDWNNYLREICAEMLLRNSATIGGPNTTVEIDESLFTRRKNQVGRVLPQQWVFGGICRETHECFMFCVPDRSAATLMPIIKSHIRPGTNIISDQWKAYTQINTLSGLKHQTVNHSVNFVNPLTGAHTQTIERTWKAAKERNKRHNGTHRHMIDSYMCEFMWRQHVKVNDLNAFTKILKDIAELYNPE